MKFLVQFVVLFCRRMDLCVIAIRFFWCSSRWTFDLRICPFGGRHFLRDVFVLDFLRAFEFFRYLFRAVLDLHFDLEQPIFWFPSQPDWRVCYYLRGIPSAVSTDRQTSPQRMTRFLARLVRSSAPFVWRSSLHFSVWHLPPPFLFFRAHGDDVWMAYFSNIR